MKNYNYCLILGLSFLQILNGCNHNSTIAEQTTVEISEKKSSMEELQSTPDETLNYEERNLISIRGFIDVPPEQRAGVSPYYGGYVKKIYVLPGQEVKEGEVLLTLQNPEYLTIQQEYLEALAQLKYLKANYERQKLLSNENISSVKNFSKAESDYRVVLARYNGLKEQIKLMGLSLTALEKGKLSSVIQVNSPISGSITKVNVTKSAFIDATKVALEIVNNDHIHLELQVFEREAMKIKIGQVIHFKIPELNDKVYKGEVYLIVKSIDMQERTVNIHGHIHEEVQAQFIPGMFVEAEIVLE